MEFKHGRYADVRYDTAFKKCFGSEQYKLATIGLLNAIITEGNIVDVKFVNTELPGMTKDDRKGIIDVLCTDTEGKTFFIEMQRAEHEFFQERTYFYSSLYVQRQAQRGDWNFKLEPSYVIAFLNFPIRQLTDTGCYMLHYRMTERSSGSKLPGSSEFFFFDLKNFTKNEGELSNDIEKWLFLVKNSSVLESRPESISGKAFDVFLEAAEIAGYTTDEFIQYEKNMVTELDIKLALNYAKNEGLKEGLAKGEAKGLKEGLAKGKAEGEAKLKQTAANFKKLGVSVADIVTATGLPEDVVKAL